MSKIQKTLLLLSILIAVSSMVISLYIIKSAFNINMLQNFSLGLWGWLKQFC